MSAFAHGVTDFHVKQGSDFRVDFRCKDSLGVVVDLSAYLAKFRAVWRSIIINKTTSDLLDFSTDGGVAAGMIHLHLTVAETRAVPLGQQMLWALELTQPNGDQIVVVEGSLTGEQGLDNVD